MKRKATYKEYGLYENGKEILRGNNYDIVRVVRIQPQLVCKYAESGEIVKCRYTIKFIGIKEKEYFYNRLGGIIEEEDKDKTLDYLYRHLAKYGNTCLNEKPTEYIPKLEKMLGEKICYRKRYDVDDPWNYEAVLSQPGKFKRGRKKAYYILEVM